MKHRISASQKLAIQNAVARARASFKAIDLEQMEIAKILSCGVEEPAGPLVKPARLQAYVGDYIDDCISDHGDVDELLADLGVVVE